jgi:PBSX family phage terminase large subunit
MSEDKFWLPNLAPKGLETFNCYCRAALICGPRKSSKCVGANTILRTPTGLRRMKSVGPPIQPGETIDLATPITAFDASTAKIVPDGVTRIFYRNESRVAKRFFFEFGYDLTTSPIHPLWTCVNGVFNYRTPNEIETLMATGADVYSPFIKGHDWECDQVRITHHEVVDKKKLKSAKAFQRIHLAVSDLGLTAKKSHIMDHAKTTLECVNRYFTGDRHLSSPSQWTTIIDEELAYVLGVFVGDGCIGHAKNTSRSLSFSSIDHAIIDAVSKVLGTRFDAEFSKRGSCDWVLTGAMKFRSLLIALRMDKMAHEKTFPEAILNSPKPVIRAFLQGLYDTDGTVCRQGRPSFCSSSEPLARDVQQVLLAFGIASSLVFRPNDKRGAWLLHVFADAELFFDRIGFRLARKQARQIKRNNREANGQYPPSIANRLKDIHDARTFTLKRADWHSLEGKMIGRHKANKYGVNQKSLAAFLKFYRLQSDPVIDQYSIDNAAIWRKIERIENVESDLYDVEVNQFHSFIGNGTINHNTISTGHRVFRHLWETPGARVALFAKTIKSAKDGGVWNDLTDIIAPEWMASGMVGMTGMPMEYTSVVNGVAGPKSDGATRTMYFTVRNMYGGNSELLLFSLDDEKYVEAKVKSMRFSLIWFSELSNFVNRECLNVSLLSLRMPHLKYEQHLWIADTNPAKEGKDSWIYKLWYMDRVRKDHPNPNANPKEIASWIEFQKGLRLIEFTLDDNPFLGTRERNELESLYADDPGEYDRNVLGIWTKGRGGIEKVFADVFLAERHVISEAIDVSPDSDKLFTSWDLGSGVNSAAVILEKRFIHGTPHWMILEEHVSVDIEVSTEDFAFQMYQKMVHLEEFYKRRFTWTHWSDSSSTDVYRAAIDGYDAGLVAKATQGRVELQGVEKPKGSVLTSIRMIRRLLRENRLFVGENCPNVIKMFEQIEHGKEKDVDDGPLKHVFDATRYAIYAEGKRDIDFDDSRPQSRNLISVG